MKKSLLSICAVAVMSSYAGAARAQSVDYGSLQDLFGEPVTTSATGTPQRASEVATNMTIITADEIRQSGSRDIPQILSRVPGLDIMQEASNSWDVGVRGYQQSYNPRLLVLIDGRQVFNDDYSRTNWDNLPVNVDDIRQIEVVKGPASALYGSNASGGVVNIITYSPMYDKSDVASATIGTQNRIQGDGTVTMPFDGNGGVKLSSGGMAMHEFDTPRPTGEAANEINDPFHRYVAQSSAYKITNDMEINTEANYSEKNDAESDFLSKLDPVRTASYSAGGGLDWQTPYGLIKNNNYINHYNTRIGIDGQIQTSNTLVDSQLEDQFRGGADHTFRVMTEYKYKAFSSDNNPTFHPQDPHLQEFSYATGGTWLWQINSKLAATNAVRLEHNVMEMDGNLETGSAFPISAYNQAYNTVSANSGLVYELTDLDSLRATFARGVQNPSEIDSGFNDNLVLPSHVNSDVNANPYVKPTVVQNYELGYDRKVPDIFSTAKLSAYYETNRDLVARSPVGSLGASPDGVLSEQINVGNSNGWGGEIELKGSHPTGFRWDASYSFQTIRDASLVLNALDYQNSAPEHHLRLLLGYSVGPWEFDTNAQYVTSTDMLRTTVTGSLPVASPTAGYMTLSGRIGYTVDPHFTVAVSAFNITQDNLAESAYPDIERQVLLTLTGKF